VTATSSTATQPYENPPARARRSAIRWVRESLFPTWYDSLLTIAVVGLVMAIVIPAADWARTTARWEVIPLNLRLLMVGQYPIEHVWRVWVCVDFLTLLGAASWGIWAHHPSRVPRIWLASLVLLTILPVDLSGRANLAVLIALSMIGFLIGRRFGMALSRSVLITWAASFPIVILLLNGVTSDGPLTIVGTNFWGGLLLTLVMSVASIALSFPLGVVLALGRQSQLPIIRWLSTAYIEIVRALPVIAILFIAQIMLPLFLPPEMRTIDRVLRAVAGLTLFIAAYQAENVRGGLQTISRGQYEAAFALGLNSFQTTYVIVLPQALRAIIPVLVGQFIMLFKDTSLVAIFGLVDLVGIARAIANNPKFIGTDRELYLFVALVFWVFCFVMSYASQHLERRLGVGER
jgi:general L-amino acid transport system permease protein